MKYVDPDGEEISIGISLVVGALIATGVTMELSALTKELSSSIANAITAVKTSIQERIESKVHMTYTMTNSEGVVYSGRTSGYGDPSDILDRRQNNHHMSEKGFSNVQIDQIAYGEKGRLAIRGREQQLIDRHGGAQSDTINGHKGTSGNAIRSVSKINPKGPIYHEAANNAFGNIAPYTGLGAMEEK